MFNQEVNSNKWEFDRWIFFCILILFGIGILMVFSTTAFSAKFASGDKLLIFKKHIFHLVLGIIVGSITFFYISLDKLRRSGFYSLFICIALLVAVLIPGVGDVAGGARRWISLGFIRFQPGEIAKLLMIIYFATYIQRQHSRLRRFIPGAGLPFCIAGAIGGLLLLQPDFGSTVVLMLVVFAQFLTFSKLRHLLLIGGVGAVSATILILTSPYRMKRLLSFINPFDDAARSGYQLIQSLIAVGAGGVDGSGLGSGHQKLFYLPAAHTDFIFAMIAEELGLIGALFVLVLFLILLFRGLRVAFRANSDPFICALSVGCTLLIVLPALLNMAVVIGLLPTKGMVLPFVAYGGTALMVQLATAGLLLRLSAETERIRIENPSYSKTRRAIDQSQVMTIGNLKAGHFE